ncbi:MAG: glycine cleavage system protein GcvH [Candidatus Cloacimonetes bacterium]|nr:glycine cleavage system protein GcvH [Candidatus Cloacimonadota bacterium]
MVKEDLLYSETHEWVKVDGDEAYIGLSHYAQHELGDIVFVELPDEGDDVTCGEPFGSVEAVKAVEDILSPVSGEVIKVNTDLDEKPELINQSPYENGWLIKVKLTDTDELTKLMSAKDYQEMLEG